MSDFNLDSFWPFLIGVVSNKISNSASTTYRRMFDVGIAEWRVLSSLYAEKTLTAKAICGHVGQDKAAISRALKKLESDGYVESTRSKTNGDITSRMVPYRLTNAGTKLYKKMLKVAEIRQSILEQDFTQNERKQFTEYLQRIQSRLPSLIEAMDRVEK